VVVVVFPVAVVVMRDEMLYSHKRPVLSFTSRWRREGETCTSGFQLKIVSFLLKN
jgi:hypothetical protein